MSDIPLDPPGDGVGPEPDPPATPAPRRARTSAWTHLQTAWDVAEFLELPASQLTYVLFRAEDERRYRTFEIPKRSGGMRTIDAPIGLLRTAQERLAPKIAELYDPHPGAHGFLPSRSVVTNAAPHAGQKLVLNIDLADFFPTVNFGRVRGLFLAAPFGCGPGAAAVLARICTHRNGLPQGAPTSPALSNFIAASLDRRLSRLARENGVRYGRYADDITFSTNRPAFPAPLAAFEPGEEGGLTLRVRPGEALERAVAASGFAINPKKVRLQTPHERQSVTGLVVNERVNVERARVRRLRAMIHAWRKHGLLAAGQEHVSVYRPAGPRQSNAADRVFRNVVYGELAYLKMVRGAGDPVFLKLCAQVLDLDPNPSKFLRQMVFGAGDYDVFLSHASEDKETIARPIFEACARLGIKAFLDEEHIGWGESFTKKINTALGAARTIVCIVSSHSVSKEWPVLEMNAALSFDASGQKKVVPLMVGRPDLSKLPLMAAKDFLDWSGDADLVATKVADVVRGKLATTPPPPKAEFAQADAPAWRGAVPQVELEEPAAAKKRGFWGWLFGRKPK